MKALVAVRLAIQLAGQTLLAVANALRTAEMELGGIPMGGTRGAVDVAAQWADDRVAAAGRNGIDDYGPSDGPVH